LEQNELLLLEIKDLSVSYGSIVALREVSLSVKKGEVVALVGANGAGKSTMLKTVLGLQRATSGSIFFMGQEITRVAVDRIVSSGIVLIPEGRGIVMEMSVIENLELGSYHRREGVQRRLEEVFHQFPILGERREQRAGSLSGGEQQMLAIGRALMGDPNLIMMDEPSLGLAPIIINHLYEIITKLKDEQHNNILLAEQNATKALRIADRGYVFEKGRIVIQGTNQELIENDMVRQAYLGG